MEFKTYKSNLVHTTRVWNNLHRIRSKTKYLEDSPTNCATIWL